MKLGFRFLLVGNSTLGFLRGVFFTEWEIAIMKPLREKSKVISVECCSRCTYVCCVVLRERGTRSGDVVGMKGRRRRRRRRESTYVCYTGGHA
ncbi:hypothetical protein DFP73DRAFT_556314 [Morchella snyderi]|nr:hypothetical protein DFP73DRAFT_556314 [Morchella snyderi]